MFAKILDSEEYGQILLIKDYDSEVDLYTIRFLVKPSNLGVCETTLKWGPENLEDRDKCFDSITVSKIEDMVQDIFKINNMLSEEDYFEGDE